MKLFSYAIIAYRYGVCHSRGSYTETRIRHGVYKDISEANARDHLLDELNEDAPPEDGWLNHSVYTYEITEKITECVLEIKESL